MKIWLAIACLVLAVSIAHSDDSLANRPELYGRAPAQWKSTTAHCADTTIKTTSGVLNCVTVTSAPVNAWSIRDSSTTLGGVVISTFGASATPGSYCYGGAMTTTGIQVIIPASGSCSVAVTYR